MPVFNLVEIAKIVGKLLVIGILSSLILSFAGSFFSLISSLLSKVDLISSSLSNLNLGWFASAIGLVSFLNSLMISFYVALSVLVSSVVTIITFKFGLKIYMILMRV